MKSSSLPIGLLEQAPEPLEFHCQRRQYEALGYIVSNHLIKQALFEQVSTRDNSD